MITATWCENSALSVGMPRRSTEWSTESSCTRVARWISSTTAASVTARGSSAPEAWFESRSSVGRNSLPFIRNRCPLTSAMVGKSAAMMRRSSPTTRSSCAATGRWMSRSEAGVTCWLTLPRLGERPDALADVLEADIHGEDAAVQPARLGPLLLLLQRPAQPVQDPETGLVSRGFQVERAPQDRLGHHVGTLLDEAHAQRLGALQLPLRGAQRLLKLGDRLVEQPHLLERHAEVVMRLEVRLVDVLVDPLPEPGQHLLEIPLLVAGGLFVRHLHPGVARPQILLKDHRRQIHESAVLGRRLVAHLHLGVLGRGPALPDFGPSLGRRRGDRRKHRERGLGPLVARVVLRDAVIHRPRLVRQVVAQQGVGELEVRLDQLRLVARFEGELHLLLAVAHAVRIESQDLVHEVLSLPQVSLVLEARRREIQLFDPALALALLDQRLAERLVRFGIVRVV